MFLLFLAGLFYHTTTADTLFLSLHHYENIFAIDVSSGNLISQTVLDIRSTGYDSEDLHWRGTKIDTTAGIFYGANSKADYSFVGKWRCTNQFPLPFVEFYTQESDSGNDGLDHPYELYLYNNSNDTYVSSQNTESILVYDKNGKPLSFLNEKYPGAVISYSTDIQGNGLRGITIDSHLNLLFAAHETLNFVLVYDISDDYKNVYNITFGNTLFEPIGIFLDSVGRKLYIGDNYSNKVWSCKYNTTGCEYIWESPNLNELSHPQGITLNADKSVLFVVSQDDNSIVMLDSSNGFYKGNFFDFSKYDVVGENLLYDTTNCGINV